MTKTIKSSAVRLFKTKKSKIGKFLRDQLLIGHTVDVSGFILESQ
jgi:hypothetical protein